MTTKTGLSIAVSDEMIRQATERPCPLPPDSWRRRAADWLSGWSVALRERLALRLAPWLDRGEEL